MLFVYGTYHYGWEQDTDSVCSGNFYELIEVESEKELQDHFWEMQCEQANDHYHDETEMEWGEFVEENSDHYVYFPYDPSREGHVELKGYEDIRPERVVLMAKRKKEAGDSRILFVVKDIKRILKEQVALESLLLKYKEELDAALLLKYKGELDNA